MFTLADRHRPKPPKRKPSVPQSSSARVRQRANARRYHTSSSTITRTDDSTIASILKQFHKAPGNLRPVTPLVASGFNRDDISKNSKIDLDWAPEDRADTQTPFITAPNYLNKSTIIDHLLITGQHSKAPTNISEFIIYITTPYRDDTQAISYIQSYLKDKNRNLHASTTNAQFAASSITPLTDLPLLIDHTPLDTSFVTSPSLLAHKHAFKITTTTSSKEALALFIMASRQCALPCLGSLPDDVEPFNEADKLALEKHFPTVIRFPHKVPSGGLAKMSCALFERLAPQKCLALFRESLLHELQILLNSDDHRQQAANATAYWELPFPIQSLFGLAEAVQPTTRWESTSASSTCKFQVAAAPHNGILRQSQRVTYALSHPLHPSPIRFTFNPPSLDTIIRGEWDRWFHTAVMVKSPDHHPWPEYNMEDGTFDERDGNQQWIVRAMRQAFDRYSVKLEEALDPDADDNLGRLNPAPDLTYILAFSPGRTNQQDSKQRTDLIVSLDPTSYALLAATNGQSFRLQHPGIKITTHQRPHLTEVRFYPHHRSLLGGKYHDLIADPATRESLGLEALDIKTSAKGHKTLKGGVRHVLKWTEALLSSQEVESWDEDSSAVRTSQQRLDRLRKAADNAARARDQAIVFAAERQAEADRLEEAIHTYMDTVEIALAEHHHEEAEKESKAADRRLAELEEAHTAARQALQEAEDALLSPPDQAGPQGQPAAPAPAP